MCTFSPVTAQYILLTQDDSGVYGREQSSPKPSMYLFLYLHFYIF